MQTVHYIKECVLGQSAEGRGVADMGRCKAVRNGGVQ